MEPFQLRLAELIVARRDHLVETCKRLDVPASDAAPVIDIEADIPQMIDGFVRLLVEALEGQSREVRTFYLETMIPAVIRAGGPPHQLIGGSVQYILLIQADLLSQVDEADRSRAAAWLAMFFGEYIGEMSRMAMKSSSQ